LKETKVFCMTLSVEVITARRNNSKFIQKVIFGVRALYGSHGRALKCL
jgi:hypothetical protein